MRVPVLLPVFVCILFASTVAFAHDVHVDYDRNTNFAKYSTFMWVEKPQTRDGLTAGRIVDDVNAQLRAKGLQLVASGADLGVSVAVTTEEKQVYNTVYDNGWGWGWGWGGPGFATTYVDTYLEGTTTVDLIDLASEKIVWRGIATGGVSTNPSKVSKKNTKLISEMFERYPYFRSPIS